MRIGRYRATQIQQICNERGIKTLVHFTRIGNLNSILQKGLLSRKTLEMLKETHGQQFLFNDLKRYDDHKEAICLSISFPNYQMFYKYRKINSDENWVVLLLDTKVLWALECAFCRQSAAYRTVTKIPLAERQKPEALKGMFADFDDIKRQNWSIPKNYPTHPQAEVLVFDPIPVQYINTIYFWDSTALTEWFDNSANSGNYSPRFSARNQEYFEPRSDYEVWRSAHFNGDDIPESDEYLGEFVGEDDADIPF